MKQLRFDMPTLMSALTVLGMILAIAGTWPPVGELAVLRWPGLALVYVAGGLPATWGALSALWREHILDIDLLMVVAAVAAAAVGAPFEGAVLLTLFSVSTTLEHQALGWSVKADGRSRRTSSGYLSGLGTWRCCFAVSGISGTM
jgi:cation transport ATPase